MFDARSLLEHIMRGGQPAPQQAGGGGLGDILGQLGKAMGQQPGAQQSQGGQGGLPGGGLGDILGQLGKAMGQGSQPQARNMTPDQDRGAGPQGGSLEDILKNMLPGGGGAGHQQQPGGGQQAGGGGLMDILGQVLGQATQGAREGAGRIDDATGASGQLRDVLAKATGRNPDEVMAQLKDLIANNQAGTAAAAGGLGAVILGTKTGRSLATKALKLGGLALIGGLAYKALQNYQQGRPLISGPTAPTEAPRGSGFESSAVTHDSAALYMRAMIAAAASDGRIDASEQQKLIGGVQQAGLGAQAQEFLTSELNNPATPAELAQYANSPAEAVQLYTAARVSIDLDTAEEHEFLVALQQALGIDDQLAAHIDAEARAAA